MNIVQSCINKYSLNYKQSEILEKLDIKTKYIVAMAAEYSSRKDYPTFIRAANIILEKRDDVTFICMGSGDKQKYLDLIKTPKKQFVKLLDRQLDVESIFNICSIGVLCSVIEGIPNSILEFMALGKPVIANQCEGVGTAELVKNEINGYLIAPQDEQILAKKVNLILDNHNLRSKFGIEGIKIVESKFNIEQMINAFTELFQKFDLEKKI